MDRRLLEVRRDACAAGAKVSIGPTPFDAACASGVLSGTTTRPDEPGPNRYSSPLGNTRQATAGWRAAAAHCWNPRRKLRFQVYQPCYPRSTKGASDSPCSRRGGAALGADRQRGPGISLSRRLNPSGFSPSGLMVKISRIFLPSRRETHVGCESSPLVPRIGPLLSTVRYTRGFHGAHASLAPIDYPNSVPSASVRPAYRFQYLARPQSDARDLSPADLRLQG